MTRETLELLKQETYLTADQARDFSFGRLMGGKSKKKKSGQLDQYFNQLTICKTQMELDRIKQGLPKGNNYFQGGKNNGSKNTA